MSASGQRTGRFAVEIPNCSIKAKAGQAFEDFWPSGGIAVNGFTFDSDGEFDFTLSLPGVTIAGISMSSGGPQSHNYIRFKRQDGATSFTVQDRRRAATISLRKGARC